MSQAGHRVTLWGIEAFLALAEEGSVSAAARRLGLSKSGVSQQITALEAALDAVLIDRSTRPVTLTPAGQIFRRRAATIMSEAHQARAELAAGGLSALTDLRLGMIEDFDADVTPRLLSGMAADLSSCQFLLETGPSHRLFDQLEVRGLDMIVAADIAAPAAWMEVHPLMREPFVAAVPKERSDLADGGIRALRDFPLILYTQRHHMGRQIAAHLARQSLTLAHRFELDSYHAIMAMVAEGAGWTILTPLGYLRAQRFLDRVDLHPLPVAPLERQISLYARRGVLGDMPDQVAGRLRELLQELIVAPACARLPWLETRLQVLQANPLD